jgi:hypothetical protein
MNIAFPEGALRQRADYTHKFNTKTGRHGWLRLTPAYSLKIVEELIVHHSEAKRIFDPFCGTGTTALSAAYHGHEGVTTDINPFLVWFASAKLAKYSASDLKATIEAAQAVVAQVRDHSAELAPAPPIFNIERWWSEEALVFLRRLIHAIDQTTKADSPQQNLLRIAFCRTLIEQSNAAFNHQSMSFKEASQFELPLDIDRAAAFSEDVRFVVDGAAANPKGVASVYLADSRSEQEAVTGPFDLVVTSPPYVNRMSYIRELRPYMYWLGFLQDARDAGELDWTAIGGTWGIATSRLNEWSPPSDSFKSTLLASALGSISSTDNKNGPLLSRYVAKYFEDMWTHFRGIVPKLADGAEIHYIVGNSTFYGTLVPAEALYAEMLRELGFRGVVCNPIRKRNSKKELVEYDVVAKWR